MLGGKDSFDRIVQELQAIRRGMGIDDGGTVVEEINVDRGGSTRPDNPIYYTTGSGGVQVPAEWEKIELGFPASVINVRADDDILVAFRKPHDNNYLHIPVYAPQHSPFNIGGAKAVNADTVWVKQSPTADGTPVAHLIALR